MDRSETNLETKLGLVLSAAEKKLLDHTPFLGDGAVAPVKQSSERTVPLSVVQLDDLADALSVKANQTEGRVLQRRLDTLVRKIDRLTSSHSLSLLETETPGDQAARPLRSEKMSSAKNVRRIRNKPR
jgi:hypothetical protein